jgi:NTE family protein
VSVTAPARPRIGLALGSANVRPDLVCGTSIGALVGAAYALGELDRLEKWVRELGTGEVIRFMDLSLGSGVLKGDRLMEFFRANVHDRPIEDLPIPFAAVATSLQTGAEVWLRSGSTLDAVRSSIALPGVFAPARWEGSLLVDGGLVNPIPVSLARAMGADVVIAVDLGSDIVGRRFRAAPAVEPPPDTVQRWMRQLRQNLSALAPEKTPEVEMPSMLDVLSACLDIVLVRTARSRMAGEPPDVVVAPRLARLRLFDFHRGTEAIEEGRRAVERAAHSLAVLGDLTP